MVRFKNRYVVFEVCPHGESNAAATTFRFQAMHSAILKKVEELHGDFGVAAVKSGFTTKYCNKLTRVAIVRARHGPHRLVASCLPLITHLDNHPVSFRTLYTGATLHHCFKFLQAYQLMHFRKLYPSFKTDKEKDKMKKALLDLMGFKKVNQQYQ